ncbi:hypothetical protein GCM10023084_22100 [Streptomyces lacrimifluminis]|uniref:DUF4328 domain-containing protein n=1 Tax=Streptomyces lacrimifluminis TaxID=1500077 RepID=A0A917L0X2_9ACTN|nr:DUF4328 domain-containing protein [Streptomyces lacrimifluminis]GGJ36302.1 hypothetical protein GCM10012282_36310 [Streptomyces lacrimifluminis]
MFCKHCKLSTAATPEGLCWDCADAADEPRSGRTFASRPVLPAPPAPTGPVVQPHGPAWLRSPVGLGKAVAVLLGVVIAVDLFAVYADFTMYDVMSSMTDDSLGYDGYNDLQGDAERADSLFAAAAVAQMVAFVAAIVVYLVWFLRVRVNAEVFNPFGHSKKRAWAGWGWFVPVVSLWFPRRIMLDIWDASSPAGTRTSHALVNAWWTLWLVAVLTRRLGSSAYNRAETLEEIRDAAGQVLFSDSVDIVAAVLAILVVLRLTRMQHEKAQHGPVPVGV